MFSCNVQLLMQTNLSLLLKKQISILNFRKHFGCEFTNQLISLNKYFKLNSARDHLEPSAHANFTASLSHSLKNQLVSFELTKSGSQLALALASTLLHSCFYTQFHALSISMLEPKTTSLTYLSIYLIPMICSKHTLLLTQHILTICARYNQFYRLVACCLLPNANLPQPTWRHCRYHCF